MESISMNHAFEHKHEKLKKTPEAEGYDDYENKELESYGGSSRLGEEQFSEHQQTEPSVNIPMGSTMSEVGEHRSSCPDTNVIDTHEDRIKRILKQKWLSLTGRRPKSIPIIKRYLEVEELNKVVFFGDRAPAEVERNRDENWRKAFLSGRRMPIANYGILREEVRLPFMSEGVYCLRYETKGHSLATAYRNGFVQVRLPHSLKIISTLKTLEAPEKVPVRALCYHPYNSRKLYLAGATGYVQVFDIESANRIGLSENIKQINNLDISSDGYAMVTVGRDARVCVLDSHTLQVISMRDRPNISETTTSSIDDEYHRLRIYGLRFYHMNPNIFFTGGWDRTLKIWDTRIPGAIHSIRGPYIFGDSIDSRENKILTGSWTVEDSLKIWDFSTRKLIKTVPIKTRATKYEGEFLYTARYLDLTVNNILTEDDYVAVGGSGFNEVCVINVNTETVAASFPTYKLVITLDSIGNYVAYGGRESLLRLGEVVLPSEELIKKISK